MCSVDGAGDGFAVFLYKLCLIYLRCGVVALKINSSNSPWGKIFRDAKTQGENMDQEWVAGDCAVLWWFLVLQRCTHLHSHWGLYLQTSPCCSFILSLVLSQAHFLCSVCVHGTKPRDIKKEVKYLILLSPNYKESFFGAKFPPNLMLFSIYLLSFIFSDSFFAFIKECVPVTLKDHFHIHTFFCTFANQTQM